MFPKGMVLMQVEMGNVLELVGVGIGNGNPSGKDGSFWSDIGKPKVGMNGLRSRRRRRRGSG